MNITSGFVSVIGRPNAGKSTLLNSLSNSSLALVSKKANATRRRMDFIARFKNEELDSQIIFIDTPGIDSKHLKDKIYKSRLLDEYMLNEAIGAIGDCDLCVFVSVASASEAEINYYSHFLKKYQKKHILVINKIDALSKNELLACVNSYKKYQDYYLDLIPLSAAKLDDFSRNALLSRIAKNLPIHPHFYEDDIISATMLRDIYKEAIREAIFERLNDEIPYQSDVRIIKIDEKEHMLHIKAQIVVEKDSQKSMTIGKGGHTIKAIGIMARKKCEQISEKKVYLELFVKTIPNWSKNKEGLKRFGYNMDMQ